MGDCALAYIAAMPRFARRAALVFLLLAAYGHAAPVATGAQHSLALHADGTVRSWGDDSLGALGVGRSLATVTPTPVAGLTGVVAVAAGGSFTVALKGDGTVWAWGSNGDGELGDGTCVARSTPGQVIGLTDVKQISAGLGHVVARKADGTVWTWGSNYFGELGNEVRGCNLAAPVAGLASVIEVAAGWYHSLARTADGVVLAWGRNDAGQLGDGTSTESYSGRARPVPVVGLDNVAQISGGGYHSVARKTDGSVWAWGDNSDGAAGDGTTMSPRATPVLVTGLSGVLEVSAGLAYTVARKNDGSVWAWGGSPLRQFGDGGYEDHPTPIQLQDIANVSQIAAGYAHSLAVASDGGMWGWGGNDSGTLGDGTTEFRPSPIRIPGVSGLKMVAVGGAHSVGLRNDGTVLTWGENSWGQLGNGGLTFRSTPSIVQGLAGVSDVAAGPYSSFAITRDGRVYEWGNRLGYGVGKSAPVEVAGLTNVSAISAGGYRVIARLRDGTLQGWGDLGLEDISGSYTPVPIPGITEVMRVSTGHGHTLAVRSDGTVWAWGDNSAGQLGDGTTTNRYQPVQVPGLANAVEVVAGAGHSMALLADRSVWAWGGNSGNQVSNGTEQRIVRPRPVVGLPPVTAIAAGSQSSFALSGGRLWAWGYNYYAGIGCPACDGRSGPIQIPGIDRIGAISAFLDHVLLLREDGSVYAFGLGTLGQLGDGTLVTRDSPVVVLREGGAGSIAGSDWFLDLDPAVASTIPVDKVPVFLLAAKAAGADITADIRFRNEDIGKTASVFVFGLAPATIVKGGPAVAMGPKAKTADGKDTPIQCVLAQLNASGQMVAVTSANLVAYLTGVLGAQGQSVSILNGTSPVNIGGTTFFVGYGSSSGSMINTGTNRGVVTVPGGVTCQPQAPQKGWWWNPAEDGRGFSVEVRGNNLFFASFLYDVSGRSTWYVSTGPVSLDGSFYSGDLLAARGGQTLGGAYPGFPTLTSQGNVTLAFSSGTTGTMIWPGGTVPIQRFNIVNNGVSLGPAANLPESGWWWNENEPGRGFFMEWQGPTLDIAGYMYDDAGNPVWYLPVGDMAANGTTFSGSWWSYGNGQTLTGAWKPNTRLSTNVAPMTVTFSAPDTALMTLPNGRTTALRRQRF